MSFLTRSELIELVKQRPDFISDDEDFFVKDIDRDYEKESHIQPCSVDLHIGEIYLPEMNDEDDGSKVKPLVTDHSLTTGQTALIRTKEKIHLPNDIAGLCFSPSRITLKGVLITNLGHIDPGYMGHLHFTVINMGKSPFEVRLKDIICTIVFVKLNQLTTSYGPESFDKIDRMNSNIIIPKTVNQALPKLSKDFLDIERRSEIVAEKLVRRAQWFSVVIPLIIAFIFTVPSLLQSYLQKPWEKEIAMINNKIAKIEWVSESERRLSFIKECQQEIE